MVKLYKLLRMLVLLSCAMPTGGCTVTQRIATNDAVVVAAVLKPGDVVTIRTAAGEEKISVQQITEDGNTITGADGRTFAMDQVEVIERSQFSPLRTFLRVVLPGLVVILVAAILVVAPLL